MKRFFIFICMFGFVWGYSQTQDIKTLIAKAEKGDAKAQYNLGICYYNGKGVERSYPKAVEWYEKAANQGLADAQYNLGNCYYNGLGIEESFEKAAEWYEKAAKQGHAAAQFELGIGYHKGIGVEQSFA